MIAALALGVLGILVRFIFQRSTIDLLRAKPELTDLALTLDCVWTLLVAFDPKGRPPPPDAPALREVQKQFQASNDTVQRLIEPLEENLQSGRVALKAATSLVHGLLMLFLSLYLTYSRELQAEYLIGCIIAMALVVITPGNLLQPRTIRPAAGKFAPAVAALALGTLVLLALQLDEHPLTMQLPTYITPRFILLSYGGLIATIALLNDA